MLSEFSNQFDHYLRELISNFGKSFWMVAGLWVIHLVNASTGYRLNRLGITTRSWRGLLGIIFAPFLHGSWNHLFFNSIPLFGLVDLLISHSLNLFYYVTGWVILVGGTLTWLLGKKGTHIGASGLIMGYFGYLLSESYFHPTTQGLILTILVIYYFGGLFFTIIPQKRTISWEGHLFGFLSGIIFAFWLYGV